MMLIKKLVILCILPLMVGCTAMSYYPYISLDKPAAQLDARVMVVDFTCSRAEQDLSEPLIGGTSSHPRSWPVDLCQMMTNEVVRDFRTNDLFKETGKFTVDPDIVLEATVERFFAKQRATPWFALNFIPYVNILPIFGIPMYKNEVTVQIKFILKRKDGLERSYTSSYSAIENYNIYVRGSQALSAQTNRALNTIMNDLRGQMIADKAFIEG